MGYAKAMAVLNALLRFSAFHVLRGGMKRDIISVMRKWLELADGAKGVVFDFGGVISYPPGDGWGAYRVARELGLSRAAFDAGFRRYRHLWDGDFIDGVDMYRRIFTDNSLAATDEDLQRLLEADCEGWVHRFNPATLALMRELKSQGRKIGILTNMPTVFRDQWFLPYAADYVALADAIVVSGEYHLYKPEPEIYRLMEQKLDLPPADLFFLDDNQPNVDGAIRCGWRAVLYR